MTTDDEPLRLRVRELLRQLHGNLVVDPSVVADELAPLATHPSPRIRQPVAEACEFLPDPPASALLAALATDRDGYVQRAAERALERRAQRRAHKRKDDEHEQRARELFEQIREKTSPHVEKLARRAARRETEYFMRKLHHEASKTFTPLEQLLLRIASDVEKDPIDRARIARDATTVRQRLALLWSILDSARDATAEVRSTPSQERLHALVEEAADHLAARLGDAAGRLRFENAVDDRLELLLHRHPLLQALQNVFQNAAEAHPAGAPIEIHASTKLLRNGSQVVLSIRDRGAGMTDEQKAHLFTPFGSRKPGGTGLGMMVVRKMIVEVHGGALDFDSALGVGTTIKMTLPVRRGAA